MLADKGNCRGELVLGYAAGAGEDDGIGVLYLVIEKLAKVFHVHFALICVHNGGKAVQPQLLRTHVLNGPDNVA